MVDEATAKTMGSRRHGELIIIKVKARDAYKGGIQFYKEENGIWLSDLILSKYIYV
ncbi:MAG: RNA 2'-phosphotransferase [Bacteroidota bacterium]